HRQGFHPHSARGRIRLHHWSLRVWQVYRLVDDDGLNTPTSGTVVISGKEVTGPGRDRGVVFQTAALLPWLTVRVNVLLAIKSRTGAQSIEERRRGAQQDFR